MTKEQTSQDSELDPVENTKEPEKTTDQKPQSSKPKAPPKSEKELPPPELPKGLSPELENAYDFLQAYVEKELQGMPMGEVQMPDVSTDSPLNQLGQILPQTTTGTVKSYPIYPQATGSTPSPGLSTGNAPPNLVGGIDRRQVALNQIPIPMRKG